MKEKEIEQRLLDEISGWFCESYCLYYGNKDYCDTCPIKEEKYWLVRPKPTGAEKRIKEIQFCDNCVHFCPIEEGEENKPNEELCKFKRPLRFRLGIDDYTGDDTGFFCPGCKNFKKKFSL